MLVGRHIWQFNQQLKAELLPTLGQVSHAFPRWVLRTHSKNRDATTTFISLSNCFSSSKLSILRRNVWPLPLLQLGISHFWKILDSVVFAIPLGIVVGCYLINVWPPLHPRHLSIGPKLDTTLGEPVPSMCIVIPLAVLATVLAAELRKQSASSVMLPHCWLIFSLAPWSLGSFHLGRPGTQPVFSSLYWCSGHSATHAGLPPSPCWRRSGESMAFMLAPPSSFSRSH